jgi:hypothetical protein
MVVAGVAGPAVAVAIGGGRRDSFALGVGEIEAVQGWPPFGDLPSREKGSTSIRPEWIIVRNDLDQKRPR